MEWHISPVEIVNTWTDELLDLMIQKCNERKERETAAIQGDSQESKQFEENPYFGNTDFIKVVKNGD